MDTQSLDILESTKDREYYQMLYLKHKWKYSSTYYLIEDWASENGYKLIKNMRYKPRLISNRRG